MNSITKTLPWKSKTIGIERKGKDHIEAGGLRVSSVRPISHISLWSFTESTSWTSDLHHHTGP